MLDKVKITPKQKGQILEAEYELYNKFDREDWALEVLAGLKQLYCAKEHPIRRAKILIDQAQLDRSKYNTVSALKNIEEGVELLKGQVGEDNDLQHSLANELAIAYAWLAITRRDNNEVDAHIEIDGTLSLSLQIWTTIVNKLTAPSSRLASA